MPPLLPFIFLAPARHDRLRISSLSAFCGLPIVVVGNAVHFGGRQFSLRLQIVPDAENLPLRGCTLRGCTLRGFAMLSFRSPP